MADLPWLLAVIAAACLGLHWCLTRNPSGPVSAPSPTARTGPEDTTLTPAELAMLATLATRYAHADPQAGRKLADYLRSKCPGISDPDLMRCVIALATAARWFSRQHDSATEGLAAYLAAMSGAALELTEIYRDEVPR